MISFIITILISFDLDLLIFQLFIIDHLLCIIFTYISVKRISILSVRLLDYNFYIQINKYIKQNLFIKILYLVNVIQNLKNISKYNSKAK